MNSVQWSKGTLKSLSTLQLIVLPTVSVCQSVGSTLPLHRTSPVTVVNWASTAVICISNIININVYLLILMSKTVMMMMSPDETWDDASGWWWWWAEHWHRSTDKECALTLLTEQFLHLPSSLLTSVVVLYTSTYCSLCLAMSLTGYLSHSAAVKNSELLLLYLIKLLLLYNGKVKFSCSAL